MYDSAFFVQKNVTYHSLKATKLFVGVTFRWGWGGGVEEPGAAELAKRTLQVKGRLNIQACTHP